jgi:hypothetical protein
MDLIEFFADTAPIDDTAWDLVHVHRSVHPSFCVHPTCTGLQERCAGSQERRAGLQERRARLQERRAGSQERCAWLQERCASSQETCTGLQDRRAGLQIIRTPASACPASFDERRPAPTEFWGDAVEDALDGVGVVVHSQLIEFKPKQ